MTQTKPPKIPNRYSVTVDGRSGAIDETGKIIISLRYDAVSSFSEGLACYQRGKLNGILSCTGDEITPPKFESLSPFSNGYAVYESRERFGYISASGEIAIRAAFASANEFREGLAAVEKTDTSGSSYIDTTGEKLTAGPFVDADNFSEGLASVTIRTGLKTGYIDHAGEFAISPRFDIAYEFSEGLAVVGIQRKRKVLHGVIDRTGKWIQEPWFSTAAARFTEGLCPIWDGNYGFIDRDGTIRIPCRFENVEFFSNGLCPASIKIRRKTKEGFINREGEWVIEPQFDWVDPFDGPLASVCIGDAIGYINTSGEFVWEPTE